MVRLSRLHQTVAISVVMVVVLAAISMADYLVFHAIAEAFAVLVAVLMLATAWYTYPYSRNAFLLFLGCGYFWVGMLDLLHALAYKGMNVFPTDSANLATQLWLTARYGEALVLLAAPLFLGRNLRRMPVFAAFGVAFGLVGVAVVAGYFPTAYVDGLGLTPFKVVSEFVIIAILLLTLLHLFHRSERLRRGTFDKMVIAIALTIVAELCFTLYVDVYGLFNIAGHIFKVLSFWIVFEAIIRTTLELPYARLEQQVAERTTAVEEREKRLRLAVEAAALGEIDVDFATGAVSASPRFLEIAGLPDGQLKTLDDLRRLYHPADRPRVARQVRGALAGRKSRLGLEFRIVRPDGAIVWVELLGAREYRRTADEGVRAVAFVRDITERKRAAEALRESEARFRQFAENLNAVAWIADARLRRLEYLSPAYEGIWGEAPDRVMADIGRWVEMVHPEDREVVRRTLDELSAGGFTDVEYRIERPVDGAVRWIRDTGFSIRDEAGVVQRIAGIARDVTAWKEAEAASRDRAEMFRALFRSSPVAMTITSMDDGRIVEANDAWLDMMDHARDEVIGRSALDLNLWPDPNRQAGWSDVIGQEGRVCEMEDVLLKKDGTPVTALSFHQRMEFKGRPHAIGIVLDITERKEAEQRQRILMREVDHRAKNALAVVQALVRLTKADTTEAFITAVQGRVSALARAHSLLAQNRWMGADLHELIETDLRPFCGMERARCHLSGPTTTIAPEAVQAVGMVFHELATNAAKHGALSTAGGVVDLTWEEEGGGGLGFVWRETGGPAVRPPSRTGFGSTMISSTVRDQLGGAVHFDWMPGGLVCTFSIAGDRVGRRERLVEPPSRVDATVAGKTSPVAGCRVLVVEDEALIALGLREDLGNLGCTPVGPAATVEEALRLVAQSDDLDAAVVDVNLRGREAWPVAEALRAKGVPFVFATGYGEVARPADGIEVLQKPFSPDQLRWTLQRLLEDAAAAPGATRAPALKGS